MDEFDSYLSTVDELVDDESKIVTYKLLSQQLALPADKAKEVLEYYVNNHNVGQLSALYVLTGRMKCSIQIDIVPRDKVEFAKSQMESVLSCHVYSVQKTELADVLPLYSVDYDATRNAPFQGASFSSIRFHGAKQTEQSPHKSSNDTAQMKNIATVVPQKSSERNHVATVLPTNQSLSKDSRKENAHPKKPSAIAEAFKKSAKTKEDLQTNGKEEHSQPVKETKKPKAKPTTNKSKGMEAFMTKGKTDLFKSHETAAKKSSPKSASVNTECESATQSQNDTSLNEDDLKALSEEMEIDDFEAKKDDNVEMEKDEDKVAPAEKPAAKPPKSRTEAKKKPKSKPKSTLKKKRSRIKELSSSSSDSESEQEDFDNVDIIPSSPTAPPVKSLSPGPKNPRKKRVLKSRTYFAADGSMLTEKEWVDVSCSSEEDDNKETERKKAGESSNGQADSTKNSNDVVFKKKAVVKGKQSSIMGFFKKAPT